MDTKHVESHVSDLTASFKSLADDKDLAELLRLIHQPGWTTPAETIFVTGLLESMKTHVQHLTTLKQSLITGARVVGKK